MKRAKFNDKVTDFLERASQCMDGDAAELGAELVHELAKFYSDRKLVTRFNCAFCRHEWHSTQIETACPACGYVSFIEGYTESQWKKKCKELHMDYVPYYR